MHFSPLSFMFFKSLTPPPKPIEMMRRAIKDVQAGRGITIYGRITEIDQAPITVSVGAENRLCHIFHFTLTDDAASISVTAWDRVSEFGNFRLGEKVMISNVGVKRVTGFFAEYGVYSANFGRGSVVSRVPDDVDSSQWEHVSVRVPSQISETPPRPHSDMASHPSTPSKAGPLKRDRDSMTPAPTSEDCTPTCSECDAPDELFCEATGKLAAPSARRF